MAYNNQSQLEYLEKLFASATKRLDTAEQNLNSYSFSLTTSGDAFREIRAARNQLQTILAQKNVIAGSAYISVYDINNGILRADNLLKEWGYTTSIMHYNVGNYDRFLSIAKKIRGYKDIDDYIRLANPSSSGSYSSNTYSNSYSSNTYSSTHSSASSNTYGSNSRIDERNARFQKEFDELEGNLNRAEAELNEYTFSLYGSGDIFRLLYHNTYSKLLNHQTRSKSNSNYYISRYRGVDLSRLEPLISRTENLLSEWGYLTCLKHFEAGNYDRFLSIYDYIEGYKDIDSYAEQCKANSTRNQGSSYGGFSTSRGSNPSTSYTSTSYTSTTYSHNDPQLDAYNMAVDLYNDSRYEEALRKFKALGDYEDASEYAALCSQMLRDNRAQQNEGYAYERYLKMYPLMRRKDQIIAEAEPTIEELNKKKNSFFAKPASLIVGILATIVSFFIFWMLLIVGVVFIILHIKTKSDVKKLEEKLRDYYEIQKIPPFNPATWE